MYLGRCLFCVSFGCLWRALALVNVLKSWDVFVGFFAVGRVLVFKVDFGMGWGVSLLLSLSFVGPSP